MLDSSINPLIPTLYTSSTARPRDSVQAEIASLVNHYLTNLHRYDTQYERREDVRYAFPAVVTITPVDPVTLERLGDPVLVVGKQISVSGLGFFHSCPLPHRCWLISVAADSLGGSSGKSQLLLRTKWCRFVGKELYESGGQFIRIVPIPPEKQP